MAEKGLTADDCDMCLVRRVLSAAVLETAYSTCLLLTRARGSADSELDSALQAQSCFGYLGGHRVMNRVALFAHFDAQDRIQPHVEVLLRALAKVCDRVIFISTSKLSDSELAKLDAAVDQTLLKDNVGLDFGMWQYAFAQCNLADADEIVLVNSS